MSAPQAGPGDLAELSLELPQDPAQIATARLFAATVGRHFGLDEEAIEDLKLGVSEAVTLAIGEGDPSQSIRIVARPESGAKLELLVSWRLELRGDLDDLLREQEPGSLGSHEPTAVEAGPLEPEPGMEEGVPDLRMDLIRGLFGEVRVEDGSAGSRSVSFTLPLGAAPSDD